MWYTLRPILVVGLFLCLSIFLNEAVIQYRFQQFNVAMDQLSRSSNNNHSLNILARLHLIQERMHEESDAQTAFEVKLQALSSGALTEDGFNKQSLAKKTIGLAINGLQFALGKENQAIHLSDTLTRKELEIAYFFERSRKYDRAAKIYQKALSSPELPTNLHSALNLHLGFCLAMLGEYQKSIQTVTSVQKSAPNQDDRMVAAKMIRYLEEQERQIALAKNSSLGASERAKQMFLLANYNEAIQLLQERLKAPKLSSEERAELLYYLGRSQEEMGLEGFAIEQYEKIMADYPNSDFAKKANRRMYILGKFYAYNNKLTSAALERIDKYRDGQFFASIKKFEKLDNIDENVLNRANSNLGNSQTVSALNDLDRIDVAKLQGDAPPENKFSGMAPNSVKAPELVAPTENTAEIAKTPIDPVRKEAIFGVIENNSGELQFIYQRWLRKGDVFEGNVTIRMVVEPEGKVAKVTIIQNRSSIKNAEFLKEVIERIEQWKFRPDPNAGPDVPITFPIRFVRS